ncbi:MAG: electron transfer flavoprotein-ubiquinone oxidoreductase [Magnetococcus sp. MYC-9]
MERLTFDVIIVGAGPAGLATACHLRTLGEVQGRPLSICVLEKAARIGGHLLSGALLDPAILTALIPDGQAPAGTRPHGADAAPLDSPVLEESLRLLTRRHAHPLPIPTPWRHDAGGPTGAPWRMLSLGNLCRWLAQRAAQQGVELFPGFAATAPIWEGERLVGVVSGALGLDRNGRPKAGFQPGVQLLAPITILAEGCRGSLSGQIIRRLGLTQRTMPGTDAIANPTPLPQRYALGLKELWQTPGSQAGRVLHTVGWPLEGAWRQMAHGGGFLYQPKPGRTALGMVIDLDYQNPLFDPFVALQQWKQHPLIHAALQGGRLLGYGARTLSIGGWQSLPQLAFAGGLLVGDSAGLLNTATFQGIGNALASGMRAAETTWAAWDSQEFSARFLHRYSQAVRHSPWGQALHQARNVRPGFRAGLWLGLGNALWEATVRGRSPWTLGWRQSDRQRLLPVTPDLSRPPLPLPPAEHPTLDRTTALSCSGLHHDEDQPLHVLLQDPEAPLRAEGQRFAHPELRYCPAGVFEWRQRAGGKIFLHMHANHCLHCKCCDIKDPLDNMRWTPPQGGSGPDYQEM